MENNITPAPKKKSKAFLYWLIPLCVILPAIGYAIYSGVSVTRTANDLYTAGQFKEARAYYDRVDEYIPFCAEMITACDYHIAQDHLEKGHHKKAYEMFTELGDYEGSAEYAKEARYLIGKDLMEDDDYEGALKIFEEMKGYEDADKFIADCEMKIAIDCYRSGDYDKCFEITDRYYFDREDAKMYNNLALFGAYCEVGATQEEAQELYVALTDSQFGGDDVREALEHPMFFSVRMFGVEWLLEDDYYLEYNIGENCLYNDLPWRTPEGDLYHINDDKGLYFYMEQEDGETEVWFRVTGFNEYISRHPGIMYVIDIDGNMRVFHNADNPMGMSS